MFSGGRYYLYYTQCSIFGGWILFILYWQYTSICTILAARWYDRVLWFDDLHQAPRIQSIVFYGVRYSPCTPTGRLRPPRTSLSGPSDLPEQWGGPVAPADKNIQLPQSHQVNWCRNNHQVNVRSGLTVQLPHCVEGCGNWELPARVVTDSADMSRDFNLMINEAGFDFK